MTPERTLIIEEVTCDCAAWKCWANDGVRALCELGGCSASGDLHNINKAQESSLSHLVHQYKTLSKPPADFTAAGAFKELCGSALPYLGEGGGPAHYQEELLALPDVGDQPCPLETTLSSAHRKLGEGFEPAMLLQGEQLAASIADCEIDKPFIDPALRHPLKYGKC